MHKDHITAFEALKKVIETEPGADIHIVCTGLTGDYRSPEYFTSLMDSIRRLGIAERVHVLGHIPKRDQMAIMRKCIAVVQPTLFEGGPGGGSVYNSIAAGIYSIVSDIAVNLEIPKNDHVVFFKAQDASDLSEKMLDAIANPRARIGWLRLRVNEKRRLRAMRDVLLPKIEQSIGRKQARGRG
jgi:glycosyltransferase involved in cell wall biosynthesis